MARHSVLIAAAQVAALAACAWWLFSALPSFAPLLRVLGGAA